MLDFYYFQCVLQNIESVMIEICTSYYQDYSQIRLNLPRYDRHFSTFFLMDDSHFGVILEVSNMPEVRRKIIIYFLIIHTNM